MNLFTKTLLGGAALAASAGATVTTANAQQVIGFDPRVGPICSGPLGSGPCALVMQWIQSHQSGGFGFPQPGGFPQGGGFAQPVPRPAQPAPSGGGSQGFQLPTLSQDGQFLQQAAPAIEALGAIFGG